MVAEKLVKCELQGNYGAAEGAAQPHKSTSRNDGLPHPLQPRNGKINLNDKRVNLEPKSNKAAALLL